MPSNNIPQKLLLKRMYNNVVAQTISDSGKFLFAGNIFGDIFVLELSDLDKSEEPPTDVKMYTQRDIMEIHSLCFHRNFLVVGGVGKIFGLKWNEEKRILGKDRQWEIVIPMSIHARSVPEVNFLFKRPNTDLLYAACGDNKAYKINLEDGRIEREFSGHSDYIHCVAGGKDDNQLYTASEDGTVRIWTDNQQAQTGMIEPYKRQQLVRGNFGNWVGSVAVENDWLVCGGGIRFSCWHLGTLECTQEFDFPGKVHVCDFVDDSVLVAGEHSHAQLYTLNGTLEANIALENTCTYSCVWQLKPQKFMSLAGFSNKLHILRDFRFLDCKVDLYAHIEKQFDSKLVHSLKSF